MFPFAARLTGDCDEEQTVIQPSRTLKKYIQLWWQIKRTKSSQDTLMRYTTSHKKFGTIYQETHINKQAQEEHQKYCT
jgi:hypothetical protein